MEISHASTETADIVQRMPSVTIIEEDSNDPVPSQLQATVVGQTTTLEGPIIQEMTTITLNDKEGMTVQATKSTNIVRQNPNPDPDDIDDKIKQMRDILDNSVDDDVLKVALRDVNWDTERAIDRLYEAEHLMRYKKEVEEQKKLISDNSSGNP